MIPRPEQNDPMHNTQSEMREKKRESIESPHHQRNKTQKKKKAATVSKKKERKKIRLYVCVCVWYGSWGIISRGRIEMMRSGRETIKHRSRKKSVGCPFFQFYFLFSFLGWNKSIDTRGGKKNLQERGIYLLCKRKEKKSKELVTSRGFLCTYRKIIRPKMSLFSVLSPLLYHPSTWKPLWIYFEFFF